MVSTIDARVPVVLGPPELAGRGDALLTEGPHALAAACFETGSSLGHGPGCKCCAPRNAAGRALAGLLQARARGEVPFFRRVVASAVTEAGMAALLAALEGDPVAACCFRKEESSPFWEKGTQKLLSIDGVADRQQR